MPYIEYKQVLTCSHKKVHSIEEKTGQVYTIKIMLNDSTTKYFKGENAKQQAEQYLQQLN